MKKTNYIYIIHSTLAPSFVKIGITTNPDQRLASYETRVPHNYFVECYEMVSKRDAVWVENELKKSLANFAITNPEVRGCETFSVTPRTARKHLNSLVK